MPPRRPSASSFPAALLLVLPALVFAAAEVRAQESPAPFTAAQADSGRVVYERSCAVCHGENLTGVAAPPLVGAAFGYSWNGAPVGQLIGFVRTSMPLMEPGTLDEASAIRVVAYLLSRNDMRAGDTPLAADAAGIVVVTPAGGR